MMSTVASFSISKYVRNLYIVSSTPNRTILLLLVSPVALVSNHEHDSRRPDTRALASYCMCNVSPSPGAVLTEYTTTTWPSSKCKFDYLRFTKDVVFLNGRVDIRERQIHQP